MSHCQTGAFAFAKPRPPLIGWLLGVVGTLLVAACPVSADEAPAHIESLQVGFRGVVEVGRWNPISIRVSGTPGTEITPRVTAADVEGRPVRQAGPPVVLSETSTVVWMVYQHGPLESPVVVELLRGTEVLDEQTLRHGAGGGLQTVTQQTDLVMCLGDPVLGFERAAQIVTKIRESRPDRVAPLVVQHYAPSQFGDLPPDPRSWEGVDACVISPKCEIPEALGVCLKAWVRRGGRLVLIGGEEVTSVASPGLANWLPLRINGAMIHHDITALNGSIPGSATLRLREGSKRTVQWKAESGKVLAQSLDGPLVVRSGESLGTVTAIALDINALPFARGTAEGQTLEWESLPDLCRWLAGLPAIPRLAEGFQRPQSDLNPTGVSDLQTQLVNTLDRFPEVVRPSYWVVLGSTLLFLVIVGPLDYLFVHRWLKRPHWTWLTLPVWIALGGLFGLSAAARTEGTRALTRQLDLVTWDAVEGEAQLDSWLTIYTPQHQRFEVACQPGAMYPATQAETRMRWAGRPEAGFRGLYRPTDLGGGAAVEFAEEGRAVRSLPIRHGASVVLEAKSHWTQPLPVTSDLYEVGDGQLQGTFSHQFDGELIDWVLVYGNFAYHAEENDSPLRTGATVRADQVPSRLVTDYLVRVSTQTVERKDRKTKDYTFTHQTYDPLGRDLLALMQTTSFYQLAGGESYTGLTNSTLQTEDLSRLVDANRAVLFGRFRNSAYEDAEMPVEGVGRSAEPLAAQYSLDGKPVTPRYRECFVRWVLPVQQRADLPAVP
jgi:hypothetical protein